MANLSQGDRSMCLDETPSTAFPHDMHGSIPDVPDLYGPMVERLPKGGKALRPSRTRKSCLEQDKGVLLD